MAGEARYTDPIVFPGQNTQIVGCQQRDIWFIWDWLGMAAGNNAKEKKGIVGVLRRAGEPHTVRRAYQTILAGKSPATVLDDVHIYTASVTIDAVKSLERPFVIPG